MRIMSWIAGLIGAAIMVDFALSNRTPILVGFWPLVDGLELPTYLAIALPLLLGLLLGWGVARFQAIRRRRAEKKAAA